MVTIQQDADTFSAKDCRHALFLHMRPRPILAVVGIAMVLLILFCLIWDVFVMKRWNHTTRILLGSSLYLTAYFFCFLPWRATRIFKQNQFRKHKLTQVIDDFGLHSTSELGKSDIPWDHFNKWKEDGKMILLYTTDTMFITFLKRLFTDNALAEFKMLAARNLKRVR